MPLVPDFRRLRTALFCGVPDRVPTAELKCEDFIKEAFLGEKLPPLATDPRGYFEKDIEFNVKAGYDFVRVAPTVNYGELWHPAQHAYATGSDEVRTRNWAMTHKGLISNEDDFDRFPWPDPAGATYEWLDIADALLPKNMTLGTSLKGGGIFERAWMLMGFEEFSFAVADRPDFVARMIEKAGSIYLSFLDRAMQHPRVQLVWLGDDMAYFSGLMVSPDFMRKHALPWYARIAELCRSFDPPKAFIFHSDGDLWEVLEDLIATGINALHPIEPKAMDIGEVKRRTQGRIAIIGNIDLGYTLTRGTPEEVREEVRQRIETCAPGGGYVVSSANSITEYVPLENYKALLAAVEEFG